jgi:hypothetical protein
MYLNEDYKKSKMPLCFSTPAHFQPLNLLSVHSIFKMLSTITVLALAVAAQAAPAANVARSSKYSVPAVHNPNFVRNGTAAMLKAYAKHHLTPTREMPSAFLNALQKRQDGSAPADPSDGVEYLVPVTVGGQKLNLDLDTGSADL